MSKKEFDRLEVLLVIPLGGQTQPREYQLAVVGVANLREARRNERSNSA
jgi:hypothetical protein